MVQSTIKLHKEKYTILNKKIILNESIYAHLGYSFYNCSRFIGYIYDRKVYQAKAIEYLQNSYELNNQNYLVCFILARTYATQYELDKALEFCLESCKFNKQFINNFALLALIYSARGELKKSELLINELYKEN